MTELITDDIGSRYHKFLADKAQLKGNYGFEPLWVPDFLYDFQKILLEWAVNKGRCAIFADCGMGKTPIQLVWAENVIRKSGGKVLILTPLAVAKQTEREAVKFGIDAKVSRNGAVASNITITNYQRLHYFDPKDFIGVVADESSILKNFNGVTKKAVTEFMRTLPYRLLATATAAPNDYIELGTSSEALSELGYHDMLARFFKKTDKTYSRRDESTVKYRFKGHAEKNFWRWVCSWSRMIRSPSDLGCSDGAFTLPPLVIQESVVNIARPRNGYLFDMPAVGLREQREERRHTLKERCEKAAELVSDTNKPAICWCHLNAEGDLLEKIIPDAVQVSGKDPDSKKESVLEDFSMGNCRVLITKPKIAGFGLNWQHCAHQTFFPSHSFEQWYQAVRRSWRYGQDNPVVIDVILSEGEHDVLANLKRKQEASDKMFSNIMEMMKHSKTISVEEYVGKDEEVPSWL